jgi:hypothetical protein
MAANGMNRIWEMRHSSRMQATARAKTRNIGIPRCGYGSRGSQADTARGLCKGAVMARCVSWSCAAVMLRGCSG